MSISLYIRQKQGGTLFTAVLPHLDRQSGLLASDISAAWLKNPTGPSHI
ncbi:MAG: hypothetical protein WBG50_08095 [Desulfomonilaceae bacterium]